MESESHIDLWIKKKEAGEDNNISIGNENTA